MAIVGIYATEQAKLLAGRTSMDVCLEAVKGALADAGLGPRDVDGVAIQWPGPGGVVDDSASWARILGTTARWSNNVPIDCMGVRGLVNAAAAIATGQCDVAVVGGGTGGEAAAAAFATVTGGYHEFDSCWGSYVATHFALIARRHMHQFGTKPEQLAHVAATIRNNGHRNPEAAMFGRGPYTPEDVLASRMVADPLHLLDICINGQGGAAMVLTSAARARDLPQRPVGILAASMEYPMGAYENPALYREVGRMGADAAARCFSSAGLRPGDVDVFCLYDPNSFEVIRNFEILGLCGEGEGGEFVEGETMAASGPCPTNLDGGMLSYAWNGGQQLTLKVVEAVKQLRGSADGRQVDGAEVAVVTNAGPGAQHFEMALLGVAR